MGSRILFVRITFATAIATTLLASAAAASTMPRFGSIVKDGDFSFRPTQVKCNIARVGQSFEVVRATGQFCRVKIWIYNHSKSSQFIDVTSQFAVDKKGRKFPGSIEADTAGNPNVQGGFGMDLMTLNPGLSVTGYLYFDMPKGDVPTYFIFHDSAFSGGADERA